MNFELTVADSFESSWSLHQSLHINFLTSNSCECPHRLLDLIVKERDSLSCRGMRILRLPDSESSTFYCVRSGAFRPGWHRCITFRRVRALPCQRGGIIGRSNFRASSFSCGKINKCMFLIMFSSHTSYPQTYPHSFAVPRKIRHPIGEKMLSR